jgi:hypothetical protein
MGNEKFAEFVKDVLKSPVLLAALDVTGLTVLIAPDSVRRIFGFNGIPDQWKWILGIATLLALVPTCKRYNN